MGISIAILLVSWTYLIGSSSGIAQAIRHPRSPGAKSVVIKTTRTVWLVQGDAAIAGSDVQPENSLHSARVIFQFDRRVNSSYLIVVAVAGVSPGLRLKLQRFLEVRIESGNSGTNAAGDFIG